MAVRARLVISGNVQDVGYRTLIRKIANKMKVGGVARNLKDGNVEVYCECANKEMLAEFCKNIDIKSSKGSLFVLNVDALKIYEDGSKDYRDPQTDFIGFEIDYGMELDPFQKATLVRSEVGILLLEGIDNSLGDALKRYDTFGKDMGTIRQDLGDLKLLAREFSEFKDLFAVYVKHQLEHDEKK